MATPTPAPTPSSPLPPGTWRVDQSTGELIFRARGMWGLAPVKGKFGSYDGDLTIDDGGARGELRIQAGTLDTGNAKRDTHLRSADFFEVDAHPTVTFTLTGVTPNADGSLTATGILKIRENTLEISTPLTVSTHEDHLHLDTTISVDRAAAGVPWSKMGMIQGKAHLHAKLTLVRQS